MRATIVVAALLLACGHASPPAPDPWEDFAHVAPKVGDRAPDFALRDVDGATVRLSDATARGPVVLVFGSFT